MDAPTHQHQITTLTPLLITETVECLDAQTHSHLITIPMLLVMMAVAILMWQDAQTLRQITTIHRQRLMMAVAHIK